MEIRPYAECDEAEVVELWSEAIPSAPVWNDPARDIERKLAVQREIFLVAVREGRVIGTAMGGYDGHRGWIYYVVVRPDCRLQGVGTALVTAVEQGLARLGCPKVNLQIRASNGSVATFYQRLGYSREKRISMGKRLQSDD